MIKHSIMHKTYCSYIERFYKQHPKQYNLIEEVKIDFDEPIRKYIKNRSITDPFYTNKISENSGESCKMETLMKLLQMYFFRKNSIDTILHELIKELIENDGTPAKKID